MLCFKRYLQFLLFFSLSNLLLVKSLYFLSVLYLFYFFLSCLFLFEVVSLSWILSFILRYFSFHLKSFSFSSKTKLWKRVTDHILLQFWRSFFFLVCIGGPRTWCFHPNLYVSYGQPFLSLCAYGSFFLHWFSFVFVLICSLFYFKTFYSVLPNSFFRLQILFLSFSLSLHVFM